MSISILLLACLVAFFGIVVFSFTVGNILTILFFGIPFTRRLERAAILRKNAIIKSYVIALIVQVIILAVVTLIFYYFFSDGLFISLLVGYLLGLFGVIEKREQFGLNINNFSDYFEVNKEDFLEELIRKYYEDKEGLMVFLKEIPKSI